MRKYVVISIWPKLLPFIVLTVDIRFWHCRGCLKPKCMPAITSLLPCITIGVGGIISSLYYHLFCLVSGVTGTI